MRLALCILALLIGPAIGHHVASGDDLGVIAVAVLCTVGGALMGGAVGWYLGRGAIEGGEG